MSVEFTNPLADARDFPPPLLSFDPRPALDNRRLTQDMLPPRDGYAEPTLFLRARYALACVAKALLKEGASILLPAYHCPAMIEPFVWAGCNLQFYEVHPDTLLPTESVRNRLAGADAILLSHFCYTRAGLNKFADDARAAGLLVIEDLAHAALQQTLIGDVGVTSLVKFLPIPFGGEALSTDANLATSVARERRRMETGMVSWHMRMTGRRLKNRLSRGRRFDAQFRYFDPLALIKPVPTLGPDSDSSAYTTDIAVSRRKNFLMLNDFFGDRYPHHRIEPEAVDETAPYAFPLLLPSDEVFIALKQRGVPLQRWEELVPSSHATTDLLRHRLVQLPVHQQLSERDMALIIEALDQVLQRAS